MSADRASVNRERLYEMMQAYKTTSLLRTGIELGVFDSLAAGPADAATVAQRLGVHPRGSRILLNALAALELLQTDGDRFLLSPGAERHLVRNGPAYLGDMVRLIASDWEWDALKRLPEAVRHGGTVMDVHAETPGYAYWEDFASFATAVATPTAAVAAEALRPWAEHQPTLEVLDVACGHGIYGFTLARQFAQAQVWALDWPNVLTVTERHAERLGVRDRTHFIAGDMFEVPLGGPYDVVVVANVLHHFSEQRATDLLARVRGALKPGGRLIVVGFAIGDRPPDQDPDPHLFSVLMLVWTYEGEVHEATTYRRMLSASGFANATVHSVEGLPLRVLTAHKGID